MQTEISGVSTAARQLCWSEPLEVWLEREDEEEVKKIEEQKKKQKKLEQELAEKRKKQKEQNKGEAIAN
jgi:hypothetical protein